jgi:hypothetical protein
MIVTMIVAVAFVGCTKKDNGPGSPATVGNEDIPKDPGGAAPATSFNNIQTIGATFSKTPGNEARIKINLLGISHPVTGQLIQLVPGSSLWITEDNLLKGVKLTSAGSGSVLNADVVFVVDNSGSMGEEADSIASKIIAFANYLQSSGLSVRVGCVGHGYNSDQMVYGAINLTDAQALSSYLNRYTGLMRTYGFSGSDSAKLAGAASAAFNSYSGGENSVIGISYADSLFSWRAGANRVYVIFTDEPTQPGGLQQWSTDGLIGRWSGAKGTIHTVYSSDTTSSWSALYYERPWDLSRRTGGTYKVIPYNAAGLDLTTLPVTGALATSVLLEYLTSNPNGTHNVVVTVKAASGADGKKEYLNIAY